jgi:starch-binding outer membrane protein, SusD/RagB family
MKRSILLFTAVFLFLLPSCLKDLDREPFYEQTSAAIYKDPANYIHVLAKLYAGLAVTGQTGPAGNADIPTSIVDEGFSQYMRMFWNLQELPTDEAKCRWNDVGIPDLGKWTWSDANQWIRGGYLRFLYQVTSCNEFIKQTKDELLDERGFSEADKARIRTYRAEARFLRALSLFHALDIFRNIPDITDENRYPGTEFPDQMAPKALFTFIESELLAIESLLGNRSSVEYGRANQACVQTLLAKLYLNADAMISENHYSEALTYSEKVISQGGYSLEPIYTNLFRADNHLSNEIIFPVNSDGTRTLSFGLTTYLINGSGFLTDTAKTGANVGAYTSWGTSYPTFSVVDTSGSTEAWQGLVASKELYNRFPDSTLDRRFQFVKAGRSPEITVLPGTSALINEGIVVKKFRNRSSTGSAGSNARFADTDFPLFRLADVYLMYAEAHLQGGGGSLGQAILYFNELRRRAYGDDSHNVTSLTLDDILEERSRELYWEGYRRTDLIRFNKFTGGAALWTWKGNTQAGAATSDHLRIYPLPATELTANPKLRQNNGY